MVAAGEANRARARNAIVIVMAVGVFALLFSKPFLPPWWRANANDLICMIVVIGFGMVLLFNKLACGVFFPGPPKGVNGRPRS